MFITSFLACGQNATRRQTVNQDTLTGYYYEPTQKDDGIINPNGQTLEIRVLTPSEFHRTATEENSFTGYLRQLPLKPHGSEVAFYDGKTKPNYDVYDAVVNLDIGKKDLNLLLLPLKLYMLNMISFINFVYSM
ncbi:MAG: hypothetical protein IIB05_11360, partial [Bacteroidetes bacterium]|nr:hypothetical protein [Bacteroidota bacterium]